MRQRGRFARPMAICVALIVVALSGGIARAQQPAMPGETLAFDRSKGNCLTCHVIKGGDAPGNVGPELSNMKDRYPDRKELRRHHLRRDQAQPADGDAAVRTQPDLDWGRKSKR